MLLPGVTHGMIFVYEVGQNKITFEDFSYLVRKTTLANENTVKLGFTRTLSENAPKKDFVANKFTNLEIFSTEVKTFNRKRYTTKIVGLIPSIGPDYFKESILSLKQLVEETRVPYIEYYDLIEKQLSKDLKIRKKNLYIQLFEEKDFLKKINNGRYRAQISIDLTSFFETGKIRPSFDYLKITGDQGYSISKRELIELQKKPVVSIEEDKLIYLTGDKQNPLTLGDLIFNEILFEGERRIIQYKENEAMIQKFFTHDFLINFPYNFDSLGFE